VTGAPTAPAIRRPARARLLGAVLALLAASACLGQAGWIHAKAWLAQALIERAYVAGGPPWPWADTRPVAKLLLPGAARPLYVLAGSSGRNLAFGPTLDHAGVLPGEPGNSIISGHRDTHFRRLSTLAVGDRIEVERRDGAAITFVVVALDVVDSRRARLVLDAGTPRLTLVTCYPFDAVDPGGPLRFVATAVPPGEL
jgi:sortase A